MRERNRLAALCLCAACVQRPVAKQFNRALRQITNGSVYLAVGAKHAARPRRSRSHRHLYAVRLPFFECHAVSRNEVGKVNTPLLSAWYVVLAGTVGRTCRLDSISMSVNGTRLGGGYQGRAARVQYLDVFTMYDSHNYILLIQIDVTTYPPIYTRTSLDELELTLTSRINSYVVVTYIPPVVRPFSKSKVIAI